jgi:glycosyltransferase involved in cell wall biosynthesis
MTGKRSISIVTSTFNESENILEFISSYSRLLGALQDEFSQRIEITYDFVIADNNSTDSTVSVIKTYAKANTVKIVLMKNFVNVGPDRSILNAAMASNGDLCLLTCSDLQDPAEDGVNMIRVILEDSLSNGEDSIDSVVAVKSSGIDKAYITTMGKRLYYIVSKSIIRDSRSLSGFHGFGVYKRSIIERSNECFCRFGKNLRLSLLYAIQKPSLFRYSQVPRAGGKSSYNILRYIRHAYSLWVFSDAFVSRFTFGLLIFSILSSILISTVAFITESSTYTAILLAQLLISIMPLYLALVALSRKIETLALRDDLDTVRFSIITDDGCDVD